MKRYQFFFVSSLLLILANYWFVISNNSFIPRLFDYLAYGFFIFGTYNLIKNEEQK